VGKLEPIHWRATRNRYAGLNRRYLRQSRRGSLQSRKSHSNPRSCIHCGACFRVPARNGNAAPTARTGTFKRPRNSYAHTSWRGHPSPAKTICAPDCLILPAIWSAVSELIRPNVEGAVPAICSPGNNSCSRARRRSESSGALEFEIKVGEEATGHFPVISGLNGRVGSVVVVVQITLGGGIGGVAVVVPIDRAMGRPLQGTGDTPGTIGHDDVNQVDITSLHFHGARPVSVSVVDVNHDGIPDLLLEFPSADIHLSRDASRARVTGWLKNGRAFVGEDAVTVVPATQALSCQSSASRFR
jgi:hypothetical protein